MKKYLKKFLTGFFKKKEYLTERQKVGFPKPTLVEIAKKVIEEEDRTEAINTKLKNKLQFLELYE